LVLRTIVFSRETPNAERQTPNAKRILSFGEAFRFHKLQRLAQAHPVEIMN
jgi:hypothetical protein